ncbi:hypothetical protein KFU94_44255 [Chloroflexi bacterium TSY]|nr:hypothetical protein [Chloroflexi bacterium TSY]
MRLQITTDKGNKLRPLQKLQGSLLRLLNERIPEPYIVCSYRRKLFGKQFAACFQGIMRHQTSWEVGEVELMGAFVSKQNECNY